MGGKTQLYKRSSFVFFLLGVLALGLQVAGLLLPFWYEDSWTATAAARRSLGNQENMPAFRVFQGPWSDYRCQEAYLDVSDLSLARVSYRNCHIFLRSPEDKEVMPRLRTVRVLAVTSSGLGLLALVGVVCVNLTARKHDCKRVTSQICLTLSSLAAGLCALMAVLVLASDSPPDRVSWAMAFPAVAGFLWAVNTAFSILVYRYDPSYRTGPPPARSICGADTANQLADMA